MSRGRQTRAQYSLDATLRRVASARPYRRRLRFESLEERRLLTVFTVTNSFDGTVVAAGQLPGSLRQAIFDANATPAVADVIQFAGIGGSIEVGAQLVVTSSITINGPGAHLLTIHLNAVGTRVFNVDDGNFTNDKTVSISGLTLSGGNVTGVGNTGGAIRSRENLTLTSCTISGNSTVSSNGGGVWQYGGSLAISSSTISGTRPRGGGIYLVSAVTAVVSDSTIDGNTNLGNSGYCPVLVQVLLPCRSCCVDRAVADDCRHCRNEIDAAAAHGRVSADRARANRQAPAVLPDAATVGADGSVAADRA